MRAAYMYGEQEAIVLITCISSDGYYGNIFLCIMMLTYAILSLAVPENDIFRVSCATMQLTYFDQYGEIYISV